MLFNSLALVSILFIIVILKRIADFLPTLVTCLLWWKENINIDVSLKTRRERDLIATAFILPFCLICTRVGLYSPDFMTGMTEPLRLGVTTGVFFCYLLVREGLSAGIRPKNISSAVWHAGTTVEYTFFIFLALVLLATSGLLLTSLSVQAIKTAMFWLSGTIYALLLVRKVQIFASNSSFFTGILYLCALEILPTAILFVSAVVF